MPTVDRQIRKAARTAGVPVALYKRLIKRGERSWRGWQTSPAGAYGPAQLMPGTAEGLAKKYGINTRTRYGNLLGGAYYLREQLDAFGGNARKAVAAYNAGPGNVQRYGGVPPFAETQRYVENVLGGWKRGAAAPTPRSPPRLGSSPAAPPPGVPPPVDLTETILGNLNAIAMGANPLDLMPDLVEAAKMRPVAEPVATQPSGQRVDPRGKQVTNASKAIDPGGGWGGTYGPASVLAAIGAQHGLSATSEKRDRQSTASGGVSDHWVGSKTAYAYDLGGSVENMDTAAVAIARRLGIKNYRRGQPLVATVVRNGLRYQILYRTNVGGNHFDHIHAGVRRV